MRDMRPGDSAPATLDSAPAASAAALGGMRCLRRCGAAVVDAAIAAWSSAVTWLWSRTATPAPSSDAERKPFEWANANIDPSASGTFEVFTEKNPCASCRGVADQFAKSHPNIEIHVYTIVKPPQVMYN